MMFSFVPSPPSPVLAALELPSPALRERGSERSDAGVRVVRVNKKSHRISSVTFDYLGK